jgi:hypothetical protein
MEVVEVQGVRKYKAGYEIRTEVLEHDGERITHKVAYTPTGDYIGRSRFAHRLVVKRGIAPQKRNVESNVCSIGFSEREQKWYGWSHRAIFGFGIGAIAKEGDCVVSSGWTDEWLVDHPEDDVSIPVGFEAKTLEDCKRMAIAFAASVS